MSGLSEVETVAIIRRLRALLQQEEVHLPLNRVATEAVLRRQPRRGEQLRGNQLRTRQRLQRSLSRYLGTKPPRKIPEKSFAFLTSQLDGYRGGWGQELQTARIQAAKRQEWEAFGTVKNWFGATTDEELAAFRAVEKGVTERGDFEIPGWVLLRLLGTTGDGPPRRCLMLDALRAGIPDTIAMEAILRILSPFCGHARSDHMLLGWRELTAPALRRAVNASIEAERIWLGLTIPGLKGVTTTARGVTPLKDRLPNPLRGTRGLFAEIEAVLARA